jgi:RNA polymerase sigma factor (sigma-70 family)
LDGAASSHGALPKTVANRRARPVRSPNVSEIEGQTDAELLLEARDGDEAAFTELYVRHRAVARRVASTYRRSDAEDLVNEAFEKVLGALRRGGGPTDAFRAYLLVTLRRLAVERNGQYGIAEEPLEEVPEPVVAVVDGPELSTADRDLITRAFDSLPDRWQAVLWYTAVEGRHPREIASRLGLSANAVSALAYRAREQLRQAYLQAHLSTAPAGRCKTHRGWLGAYVRGSLSRRDDATTRRHLERCSACRELADELTDVNRLLVRSVVPLFLVQPAGKLASVANAVETAAHAGEATSAGRRAVWSWVKASGPAAGGIAAAAGAILGLGSVSTLVWREDRPTTVQATQGLRHAATTTLPTAAGAAPGTGAPDGCAAEPAGQAPPTTTTPAATGAASTTDAGGAADASAASGEPTRLDVPLLGASVQLPALGDLVATDTAAETTAAAPTCATPEAPTGHVAPSTSASTTTTTSPDSDAVVVETDPLDITLTLDLPEGLALDIGALPADCDLHLQDVQVVCALTAPVVGTEVTADLGLDLNEILNGRLATVTLTQGDQTVEVETDDVVTTLTETLGDVTGGLLSPTGPEGASTSSTSEPG